MSKKKHRSIFWIIFFLLFIVLAGLAGLFYFSSHSQSEEPEIEVKFYKEDTIMTGQIDNYLFTFRHLSSDDIIEPEVTIIWPSDFQLITSDPSPSEQLVGGGFWKFDDFPRGKFKTILLEGKFLGSEYLGRQFNGSINFKIKGISSNFAKDFNFSFNVKPSLALEADLPSIIKYNQKDKGQIKVTNLSNKEISNVRVLLKSDNFLFEKDSKNTLVFDIPSIDASAEKILEFNGFVPPPLNGLNESSSVSLEITAGLVDKDKFFPQIKLIRTIHSESESLDAFLEISERRDEKQIASWGENIPFRLLIYNNTGENRDFSISLKINNPLYLSLDKINNYEWVWNGQKKITSSNWQIKESSDGLFILWDSTKIPELKNFNINQIGELQFSLPLKDKISSLKERLKEAAIKFVFYLNDEDSTLPVKTNEIELKIRTDLDLKTSARYYDDENWPIGQGPFPLQIGECTSLWIFFDLQNSTNSLENILVKTKLPANVFWENNFRSTVGKISFDSSTKEVSWNIPSLNFFEGGPFSLIEGKFLIKVCPQSEEELDNLFFTEPVNFQAWEPFTQTLIRGQSPAIHL